MGRYDIGPKIGIEGEKDFRDSIRQINNNMRTLGTEMQAVASQFDKNDNSTEALTSKNEVLNKQIDLQKQKLSELKKGLASAADKYGENDKVTHGWRQSVNKATADLNKMEREIQSNNKALGGFEDKTEKATKDLEKYSGELKELGGKVTKAAAAGIASVGVAAIGAIGGILKFGNSADKAMNNFQAKTGASAEKMEEFRDVANDIYTDNFGDSLDDVADSMAKINNVTAKTGEELKNTTKTALLMRDTFDFDVAESIDTVNSLMVNFKISSEEAYNLIAQGAQKGANKNGDLLDVMKEYGPNFKDLGLSAEEFTDTLIQGSISGAFQIDKVGDAVKEFSIRAKDGSDTSAEGFELLGLNAEEMFNTFAKGGPEAEKAFQDVIQKLYDIEDPLTQNQAGVNLFGTMFEDLGVEAIYALSDIEDYANRSADTLEKINETKYNDIGSALQGLKRQLITSIVDPISERLLPTVTKIIEKSKDIDITPIINSLMWLVDNANNIAAGAIAIGAGMATWNVVTMIQNVVGAIKSWTTATQGMTIAQRALNIAQTANPIGIIITLIAALVAAIIYLWNTNDDFRNALISAWNKIKEVGLSVWKWLVKFFTEDIPKAFTIAINWFKELPEKATKFFGELPGKIGYALGYALGKLVKFGVDSIAWVIENVPRIIANIVNFFMELPDKTANALANVLLAIITWTSNAITSAKTEVPKITAKILEFFKELPGDMLKIGGNIVEGLWEGIKNATSWIKKKIGQFASGILNGMKEALGIHSPSRVMRDEVGKMIGAGMAEGIMNSARQVNAAMGQLTNGIMFDPGISNLGLATGSASGSVSNNYDISVNDYGDKYISSKDEVIDYTDELITTAKNAIRASGGKL